MHVLIYSPSSEVLLLILTRNPGGSFLIFPKNVIDFLAELLRQCIYFPGRTFCCNSVHRNNSGIIYLFLVSTWKSYF